MEQVPPPRYALGKIRDFWRLLDSQKDALMMGMWLEPEFVNVVISAFVFWEQHLEKLEVEPEEVETKREAFQRLVTAHEGLVKQRQPKKAWPKRALEARRKK